MTSFLSLIVTASLAQAAPPNTVPGLTMDLWQLSGELEQWPAVVAGQTPNLSQIVTSVGIIRDPLNGPEGPINDRFAGVLRGWLQVDIPGRYLLRLVGDDGARVVIDDMVVLDSEGKPAFVAEGGTELTAGMHPIRIPFYEDAGKFMLSLQWAPPDQVGYVDIPTSALRTEAGQTFVVSPGVKRHEFPHSPKSPGDGRPLAGVHPAYRLERARPEDFKPQVGALCPLPDNKLAIATWDAKGAIWVLDTGNVNAKPLLFAEGLSEPLGLVSVDGGFIVAQRSELTRVTDRDGDGEADNYEALAYGWPHSANYHEFLFNLVPWHDRLWFATSVPLRGGLTDYLPGLDGDFPVSDGPGSLWSYDLASDQLQREARGLRTPNGMGIGVDGELFGCDNQGSWLPSSRLNHLHSGGFYGHQERRGATQQAEPPVVWFPHGEIGNSPSQPVLVSDGPHRGQMYVGDVTYGGIQRVAISRVGDRYQGTVFMHSQGLEAGVNRLAWGLGSDRALYAGGVGSNGNWNHLNHTFGLERLVPTWSRGDSPDSLRSAAFEMMRVDPEPDGIMITFSSPVPAATLTDPKHYDISAWRYEPRESYGGPKVATRALTVTSATASPDGRQVRLIVEPWPGGEVVALRLLDFLDVQGRTPWSTQSWSTINAIPTSAMPFSRYFDSPEKPKEARTLLDGSAESLATNWRGVNGEVSADWMLDGDAILAPTVKNIGDNDLVSVDGYDDLFLHLEWFSPPGGNEKDGQTNGNSGVKLAQRYEVQIMNTPAAPHIAQFNQAGSIYRQHPALVNASTGAGTWQTYDIWFTAPKWEGSKKTANARMSVLWNGTLVHDDVEVTKQTGLSGAESPGSHPILLQAHPSQADGPVRFRNIWIAQGAATPRRPS